MYHEVVGLSSHFLPRLLTIDAALRKLLEEAVDDNEKGLVLHMSRIAMNQEASCSDTPGLYPQCLPEAYQASHFLCESLRCTIPAPI